MNDTKQKLMDVTRQMIDNGGIDSVSMRELGKKMQLSRSAVYRHFKNKEDLLAAIVVANFMELENIISNSIKDINDPIKLLENILIRYYDFGLQNRDHYRLMFGHGWDKEQYPEVYAAAFKTFDTSSAILAKAQEKKCIVDKPTKELAAMVYAFIHGLVELRFAGHDEPEKGLNDPHSLISSFLSIIRV
ncbi:MAG TPA: TetR/AcrR family transcriptional regulator [Clostridia bacterium]|nr:TetR/AcrR family transcriptional regulator [Clostridia bacterium]